MTHNGEPLWTIEELGSKAALALAENYEGQRNGSVREVPDRRTIRYYTTLGLIDRPAAMRGRTALYGRRHLLQLVAIKRLQARGHTLAAVQQRLLAATDAELEKLAMLPRELTTAPAPAAATGAEPDRRSEAFWRQEPAPVAERNDQAEAEADRAALVQGVRLHPGLTLLLEAARAVEEEDIEAIRVVAEPLLKLLEKRRLLRPDHERRTS